MSRAPHTKVWFAAVGLLTVLGGCVTNPFSPYGGRSRRTDYPLAQQTAPLYDANQAAAGASVQQANATPATHTTHRPPATIVRGQNGSSYGGHQAWPAGTGQPNAAGAAGYNYMRSPATGQASYRSGDYLHGPMPAADATPRDSSFSLSGSAGRPAAGGVRRAQYEEVAPSPVYGIPPGSSAAPPAGGGSYSAPPPAVMNQPFGGPVYNGAPVEGGPVPGIDPLWSGGVVQPSQNYADMVAQVSETHTGQFMFGVGVNSDAGLTGQITIQERNFDVLRPPTSWQEFADGTAWRGGGQGFRAEAMPGTQVQRYMVSLSEPYLFNTDISFNVSGFYFDRLYFDWDEQRYGGRLGFGYRLSPDLSVSTSLRAESVTILDPRVTGVPELDDAVGQHDLFSAKFSVSQDKRDRYFSPTQGHFIELSFEQMFGDYNYSRAELDVRKYFLVRERPDGSGRHTISLNCRAGFTGADTPIFENFFAGGYSTIRGFNFRGASPKDEPTGVIVGGQFRFLASAEYMFPITADDMLRMVGFCDFGTVEEDVRFNSDTFRVAPGFGFRIFVPAMGPAPIALDFAFPVSKALTDDTQVFSFFVGIGR